MKLNKWLLPFVFAALVCSLAGCQEASAPMPPADETRTVTDLAGNTVVLPAADKLERVVIIAPPTTSVLLGVIPDTKMIVGVSSRAFFSANTEIVGKLFPNWRDVETGFVSEGFVSNTEELLNLDPDVVFYYGDAQKPGIEDMGIPMVDFMIPGEMNPEKETVAWDNLMRQIFAVQGSTSLQREWETSNQKAQEVLSAYTGEKKSALFLFSNIGGVITVSGSNTYADAWFEKSGLVNVAAEVKGPMVEVGMEQVYAWDPDYIYVFLGMPASVMLQNQVQGQDWSLLSAYTDKKIIDIPRAVYSWGAPCSDSPLMSLWLISQSYPELLGEDEFRTLLHGFYRRMYGVQLEDELITSVLSPRKPAN